MSKRRLASNSSPSRIKKKAKNPAGQSTLDKFFRSSRSDAVAGTGERDSIRLEALSETPELREVTDVDLFPEDSSPTLRPASGLGPFTPVLVRSPKAGSSTESPSDPVTIAKPTPFVTQPVKPVYQSLSVDPVIFDLDSEPWPCNNPAPYSFLSHTLATLSETRSRILIINTLTNALRTISRHHPSSLLPALYLLSNSLGPPYSSIELGLGPSVISKAIQQVSGLTSAALKRLYNTTGDVGDVAFEAKSNLRTLIPHPPLLIITVFNSLQKIARCTKGQGVAKQKQSIVENLLIAAKGEEVRFLTRTLSMNLRVGAVRTSILTALARAMVLTPPGTLTVPIPSDSPYNATPELLSEVEDCLTSPKENNNIQNQARREVNEKLGLAESLVKQVFVQHPNYDHIVAALLDAGLDGLAERVPLAVGIPLHPTLGSPTRSLDEIYARLRGLPFTAEMKLDGQRAQIHARCSVAPDGLRRTVVQIFSRHLEDMTTKYPDVVSLMQEIFASDPALRSFIVDSEIVAIDSVNGTLKTFQELSSRARKDVQIHDIKVAVGVFAFDLMYLDGEIQLEQPFRKRRALLRKRLPRFHPKQNGIARFEHIESCDSEDGRDAIEEFWVKAAESRCEGLMVKLLDSGEVLEEPATKNKPRKKPLPATYEPDKRTSAWLKLKKDYVTGLSDSLDLVPIGAWHGNGRKAQWWSPVLLAVRDENTGRLVAVCKCMSGFSDVFYKAMRTRYAGNSDTCSRQNLWDVDTGGLNPEVYFKPNEVWEIRGADITLSPVSIAARGLVSDSRGLSLRFPRFIKVREDKNIEDASNPEFLAQMWNDQQGKGSDQQGADDGELLDVDFDEQVEEDSDLWQPVTNR